MHDLDDFLAFEQALARKRWRVLARGAKQRRPAAVVCLKCKGVGRALEVWGVSERVQHGELTSERCDKLNDNDSYLKVKKKLIEPGLITN